MTVSNGKSRGVSGMLEFAAAIAGIRRPADGNPLTINRDVDAPPRKSGSHGNLGRPARPVD